MEKHRKYDKRNCIAFGCLNTNRRIPDLTLFSLPKETVRRRQWLTLIGREDLLSKEDIKCRSYEVCSAHFDSSEMTIVKKLKPNTLPTKHLYEERPASTCEAPEEGLLKNEKITEETAQKTYNQQPGDEEQKRVIGDQVEKEISRVYHFLKKEYETVKMYAEGKCDLQILSNIHQRTAAATGVSEHIVRTIVNHATRPPGDTRKRKCGLSRNSSVEEACDAQFDDKNVTNNVNDTCADDKVSSEPVIEIKMEFNEDDVDPLEAENHNDNVDIKVESGSASDAPKVEPDDGRGTAAFEPDHIQIKVEGDCVTFFADDAH